MTVLNIISEDTKMHDGGAKQDAVNFENKDDEINFSRPPPLISRNAIGRCKELSAEYMGIEDFFSVLLSKESSIQNDKQLITSRHSSYSPTYENTRSFGHYERRTFSSSSDRDREYYATKDIPSSVRSPTQRNISCASQDDDRYPEPSSDYGKRILKYKLNDYTSDSENERAHRLRLRSDQLGTTEPRVTYTRSSSTGKCNEMLPDIRSDDRIKRLPYDDYLVSKKNIRTESLIDEIKKRRLHESSGQNRSTESTESSRTSLITCESRNSYNINVDKKYNNDILSIEDEDLVVEDNNKINVDRTDNDSLKNSPKRIPNPLFVPRGSTETTSTYNNDNSSSPPQRESSTEQSVELETKLSCVKTSNHITEQNTLTNDNSDVLSTTTAEKRKRGGGKIGRRRKRGYIYDPKPLITKSKISQLSSEVKDTDYWDKRKRNNEAAKRSRENRRIKELETITVAKELSHENEDLKLRIKQLEERNRYLENLIASKTILGGNSS